MSDCEQIQELLPDLAIERVLPKPAKRCNRKWSHKPAKQCNAASSGYRHPAG